MRHGRREKATFSNISPPDGFVLVLAGGAWRGGARIDFRGLSRENDVLIFSSVETLDESSGGEGAPWILLRAPLSLVDGTCGTEFRTDVAEAYAAPTVDGVAKKL